MTNLFLNSFTESIQLLVKPDQKRWNFGGRARLFGPERFPELDWSLEDVAEEGDSLPLDVAYRRALHLTTPVHIKQGYWLEQNYTKRITE